MTTQIAELNSLTDYVLHDWREVGLAQPSAFRAFFVAMRAGELTRVGNLWAADWDEVRARLRLALAVSVE